MNEIPIEIIMNETNAVPVINKLVEWNNVALGLPSMVLILIGAMAMGYVFKALPIFPNRWVPFSVIVCGIVGNILVTPLTGPEKWVRAISYGVISGVGAWFAHKKYMSRWIDGDIFKNDSNPKAFVQPPKPNG